MIRSLANRIFQLWHVLARRQVLRDAELVVDGDVRDPLAGAAAVLVQELERVVRVPGLVAGRGKGPGLLRAHQLASGPLVDGFVPDHNDVRILEAKSSHGARRV